MEFIILLGVIVLAIAYFSINEKLSLIKEQAKFKVKNKLDGKTYIVYSVKNENSERTEFLIYDDGQWQWVLSDIYIPY
ncbi:hypothetical protein H1D32_08345 [Anaerobacillus sp. CMMVII]|uniref:hypothetical protein n=1 Tax=Anaerobacillus sp. CMMVII TaxID=2755588 RepID=UPI0021B72EE6|nr:hypothetical protein [Anaerobacillus sp. CMMVII]MCT8137765.1 hypothetical protein [Anaerobacillus sp. CMMVII]